MNADPPVELVDTHCHLNFEHFDGDRDAVLRRAVEAGVSRIVVPGLDVESSRSVIRLAERHPGVFAAVGVHPNSIGPSPAALDRTLDALRELAGHPRVVAIGEIGLDYHWDTTQHAIQQTWLAAQLALAVECGLPVILHNRESTADLLAALADWVGGGLPPDLVDRPGVLHSFSAGREDAQTALGMGFYIGFTGPITFRTADDLRDVAASVPGDRILVETDAPFLTPQPYRGERNEPGYVRFVAAKLADVRRVDLASLAGQTTANARALFRLPPRPVLLPPDGRKS